MSKYNFLKEFKISHNEILETIQGGNSDVFKYQDKGGNLRALKVYKGSAQRISQMFFREISAIKFLHNNKFLNIPQDLQVFNELKSISYRWIDGTSPESDTRALKSIFETVDKLFHLAKSGVQFNNAIDFAFNTSDIIAQIEERIINLKKIFPSYANQIKEKLDLYNKVFVTNTEYEYRTLSLADIGVHNIIRNSDTDIFIDFEFFGYDSCAKMFGDFLLHPKNTFSSDNILHYCGNLSLEKNCLQNEIWISLPLLSLKWSLITLGRAGRINSEDSLSIFKQNELQLRYESYLRYFDFVVFRNIKQPMITFHEFELGKKK